MRFLILFVILFLQVDAIAKPTVTLRQPPDTPHGLYLKLLLERAYQNINYDVEYLDIPGVRELSMAQRNNLTGVLARDVVIEQSAPELVKVEQALFSYNVLLLMNTNLCGKCHKDELNVIAYPRSGKIYELLIQELPSHIKTVAIGNTSSLIKMLEKGRIDALIISDVSVTPKELNKPFFKTELIETRYDFHYLSPANKQLKRPLEQSILALDKSGEMAKMKAQFGIN